MKSLPDIFFLLKYLKQLSELSSSHYWSYSNSDGKCVDFENIIVLTEFPSCSLYSSQLLQKKLRYVLHYYWYSLCYDHHHHQNLSQTLLFLKSYYVVVGPLHGTLAWGLFLRRSLLCNMVRVSRIYGTNGLFSILLLSKYYWSWMMHTRWSLPVLPWLVKGIQRSAEVIKRLIKT